MEREDASRAQQANALEWDLWIGLGTLALAAAGLAAATRRALFPAALGLFALAFAQGWPGVALLYVLPGLDLGAPARAACLLWPAAAWLVADMVTGQILGGRNPYGSYAPASTIKAV